MRTVVPASAATSSRVMNVRRTARIGRSSATGSHKPRVADWRRRHARAVEGPRSTASAQHFLLRYTGLMAVSTQEKVVALSHDFGSQRRLADILGVNAAQVTRWRRGEGIDSINASRVDLLDLVMAHLLRLYSAEVAERWLVGMNPSLGGRRPIDFIRRGRTREVLDAIAGEQAGSFA
jgi:uncharacterized protein (DUF2384 family)